MNPIIVYRKTNCPWAAAVIAFLETQKIPHEVRDFYKNPEFKKEVEAKSGRTKSPTLDFDGEIVADASVEQVDEVLKRKGYYALYKK